MLSMNNKLRPIARKSLQLITRNRTSELSAALQCWSSASSSISTNTRRSISTQREQHFQDIGYLDEENLTIFNTLHEMQVRSCQVYAENDLFGSFDETHNKFNYITYKEFGNQVDNCRTVLRDLGK